MKAIEDVRAGRDPIMTVNQGNAADFRGPVSIDTVASVENWRVEWKDVAVERRQRSDWAPAPNIEIGTASK
jgi:hypothetical protein